MTSHPELPDDLDERLSLLAEEIEAEPSRAHADTLSQRFGVPRERVEDVLAAVRALDAACGEDLPADLALDVPLPAGHEFVTELGRGGMGVVYRVHHRRLGRDVALKVLRPGAHATEQTLARFDREIRSLARLRHPHIVRVFEGGEVEGCAYFTMELIEGRTLHDLIRDGLGIARATRLLRQVASAVEHAHQQGVIHRDLKPSNVLVDEDGGAYVVDFGLARDSGGGDQPDAPTLSGQILGTPAYMSPEQAAGVPVGEATDVYALGAILYECLTGARPFDDRPVAELIWAVMHEEVPRPRARVPSIPRPLEVICQHAMHKDPARRYPSAKAMADDLERFAEGRAILAQPPGVVERSWLWVRRRGSHLVTAGLAILLASAATQMLVGGESSSVGVERRMAEGRRHTADGDFGAARVAFLAASERVATAPDEVSALAGWLAATANRIAELVRLGQTGHAQQMLEECRARRDQVAVLVDGEGEIGARSELLYHWLRAGALLGPASGKLSWETLEALARPRDAFAYLRADLEKAPAPARDTALALLVDVAATGRDDPWWRFAPRGLQERWLTEALVRLDPRCPLRPGELRVEEVRAYGASAPERCAPAVAALVEIVGRPDDPGLGRDLATDWQPLRLHLAMIARRDLGQPVLVWEDSHEFTGPTTWLVRRRDRLPGPIATLDLGLKLPGTGDADAFGHGYDPGELTSDLELRLGFTPLEFDSWSGRVLHVDLERGDFEMQLQVRARRSTAADAFLEPGDVEGLACFEIPWKLENGDRLWTCQLVIALEEADAAAVGSGLEAWRMRVGNAVAKIAAGQTRPRFARELWRVVDPVLDLDVQQARQPALDLVRHPREMDERVARGAWFRYARLALGSTSPIEGLVAANNVFRGHREGRHVAMDAAWGWLIARDAEARARMLDQSPYPLSMLSDGGGVELREVVQREGWTLDPERTAALAAFDDPGGTSALWEFWVWLTRHPGLVAGFLAAAISTWVRRRRRERQREIAPRRTPGIDKGYRLILIGTIGSFCEIGANGWLIPDWVFLTLAAVGAIRWARAVPKESLGRRERMSAAACFVFAAILVWGPRTVAVWSGAAMLLGLLAMLLFSERASRRRWERARRAVGRRRRVELPA